MNKAEIIKKITEKKELSQLPKKDIEKVFGLFEKRETSDEDKIKLARKKLHEVYTSVLSTKLLNSKIVDKKSAEEVLKKHISTRERFENYSEVYKKLLKGFENSNLNIFDLGAGINGLSYNFLKEINNDLDYLAVEAVGQLVSLMNYYFKTRGLDDNARAISESLFELEKIKKYLGQVEGKRVIFLFKVLDSLEMVERNYSKKLISELLPLVDRIVVSFATESLVSKKKFKVKRYWFENFLKEEEIKIVDDFEIGGERYLILEK